MKTGNTILQQLTDPQTVLTQLQETLSRIDPEYPGQQKAYAAACAALRETGEDGKEYIRAAEQEIACGLVYAGWLGLQLNLECFRNPVNTLLLSGDFETLLREPRMAELPGVRSAREAMDRLGPHLPQDLSEAVMGYSAYLQTVGYKLAHWLGYSFGNQFLRCVVPGYTADMVSSVRYRKALLDYLHLDLGKLR